MAEKPKKELGGMRNMSTGAKVAVGVFAVIMALSMMLPSLAPIFAGNNDAADDQAEASENETTAQEENATSQGDDEEEDLTKGVPDNDTLKSLAETNAEKIAPFKMRIKSNPKDLAALLNLGNAYMNWGYSATYSSSTDEEKEYAKGLLEQAVSYYDQYLELNDAKSVHVDRALCQYYMGQNDEAIQALEKLAKDNPDYPLAWANLGMLYEQQGETEKASDAYRKAVKTDKKDEYGAKSYANSRLISLNSKVSSPGDAGDASADKVSTEKDSGLTSTLADKSGVGF